MSTKEAFTWAGLFTGLSIIVSVIAIGIASIGFGIGGLRLLGIVRYEWLEQQVGIYPTAGIVILVISGVFWWLGISIAFYKSMLGAIDSYTRSTLDTETMKSDILSVLDERLAEMHHEISSTRSLVDRISRDDAVSGFDFDEDL